MEIAKERKTLLQSKFPAVLFSSLSHLVFQASCMDLFYICLEAAWLVRFLLSTYQTANMWAEEIEKNGVLMETCSVNENMQYTVLSVKKVLTMRGDHRSSRKRIIN